VGAPEADLADDAARNLERAKWRLWHGRWTGCRRKLAGLGRWTNGRHLGETAGIDRLQRHTSANFSATSNAIRTCWCIRAFSDPFDLALMMTFRESVRPARLPGDRSGRTWCQPPIRRTCASA
jgi:hypothetical protein